MPPFALWLAHVRARMSSSTSRSPSPSPSSDKGKQKLVSCITCLEDVTADSAITLPGSCGHSYCTNCLVQYVEKCCNDRDIFPPMCCGARLGDFSEVHSRLGGELSKKLLAATVEHDDVDKTYCSNAACSVYLPQTTPKLPRRKGRHSQATCKQCRRVTCRACKYTSHAGQCTSTLADDNALAYAISLGWQRCYQCRQMVERIYGCDHMT
jgi:hypothetical protein